jgi:hypothetical protein
MEHNVRSIKWNVKHMNSGVNDLHIKQRAAANGILGDIGDNYDTCVQSVQRYQSHSHITAIGDMQEVIESMLDYKVFSKVELRSHSSFPAFPASLWQNIDMNKMHHWLADKIEEYAYELGN